MDNQPGRSKAPPAQRFHIPKSRYGYDSVDCYIADTPFNRPKYNDNNMPIDPKIRDHLIKRGVDPLLATHFAHLFIWDPIVIFEETMCQDNAKSSDHFESIQSTNWRTVRFKLPPPGSPIGWRVEFRSMEVQLTNYENAAFSVFIVLLTRAIMMLGLNFYLPISKVDENMHRAHRRNAINTQNFYFRKNPVPSTSDDATLPSASAFGRGRTNGFAAHVRDASTASSDYPASPTVCSSHAPSRSASPTSDIAFGPVEDEYDEFSINEIINGSKEKGFPGLIGVVERYLDGLEKEGKVSEEVRKGIDRSLELIRRRADGSLITLATYIRRFVRSHPSYAHDSVVSQEINYDLIRTLDEVEQGYDEDKKGKGAFVRCCGDVVGDVAADDAQSEGSEGLSAGAAVIEDKGLCCGPMEPASAAKEA
ncbi:glutamate--cysteine ligase [Rhodotorula toruloides]